MADFKSGENPFADQAQPEIPSGVSPFAVDSPAPQPETLKQTLRGQTEGYGKQLETGIANATSRVAHGVGQMLPDEVTRFLEQKGVMPTQRDIDLLESATEGRPAARTAQIGSDIAMAMLPAVKAAQGGRALSTALGRLPRALPLLAETGAMGGYGALTADEGRGAEGAAWGAGGTLAGHALSRALTGGFKPTKEAQALMDQGIQPSFGQSMGGMANTIEQKAASIPFVGDAVNYARRRAQKEFEAAALQRAAGAPPPTVTHGIVERVTKGAPKTLDEANAIASQKFNDVVPHLKVSAGGWLGPREAMEKALENPEMTAQSKRILRGLVNEYLDPNKITALDAEGLKQLDSQLGFLVRKYQAGDPAAKTLADEIRNVQAAYRSNLNNNLPDGMKGGLTDANRAWAKLVPINKAASTRADELITPRALQKAMASQARQDVSRMPADSLVDNAVAVLGQTVPDSGTAGRLMLGGGGLVGSGALGLLPQYLGAGGAAYVGATRPVQRALVGNTAWQKALAPYDSEMAAAIAAALRGNRNE